MPLPIRRFLPWFQALSLALALGFTSSVWAATTQEELVRDAREALETLRKINPAADVIAKSAKGVLVFPNIIKAGLVFGGSYGEGVLFVNGKVRGFYNSVSASWGLQLGAQSYGYALFLMTDSALKYLEESHGWELGTGPTITVVDAGLAKNLSTTTLRDDAYAFIFDQQGLMGGINIEGTKITRIKQP